MAVPAPGPALPPAAPGDELLVAVGRWAERADGVGADPRGLVAGQGFELLAHAQVVALVDQGHLVGYRHADLAALLAAGGSGGHLLPGPGARRHVRPGAAGPAEDGGGEGGERQVAHGRLRCCGDTALWAGGAERGKPTVSARGSGFSRELLPWPLPL